jgi:hypothetical protein
MRTFATRRMLIQGGASAAIGAVIGFGSAGRGWASDSPYKRKNIDSLSQEELANYKYAVQKVIERGAANPARMDGYVWQAALHNDRDRRRPDGKFGRCEHNSEQFLPWHRAHLVGFERILRAADPQRTANITLPYWDWSKPPTGRRFPAAFEEAGSPLMHQGRFPDNRPDQWAPSRIAAQIASILKEKDWNQFAGNPKGDPNRPQSPGDLESKEGLHNAMHPWIGETMADPAKASNDPIYWSFHCFIDLVWARWQRLYTSAQKPQPFADGKPTLWVEPFNMQVKDTSSTVALGYEYDYDFGPDGPPVTLVADAGAAKRSIPIVVTADRQLTISGRAAELPKPQSRALLRIRDIKTLPNASYKLRIYVHPSSIDVGAVTLEERSKYLADTRAIWQGHHQDGPIDLYVDVSQQIKALEGTPWLITVMAEGVPVAGSPSVLSAKREALNKSIGTTRTLFRALEIEER